MSYLDVPRMNFSGMFQADVSTINNDVNNFNNASFDPEQQSPKASWNPDGTGSFRLVGCVIQGGRLGRRLLVSAQDDPAIGMKLDNANQRVSGKLVDLDPQQQMVSEIWGLQLRLSDGTPDALFQGNYETAAFTNLWRRQQNVTKPNDQTLAAVYQSVLGGVAWRERTGSALLDAIRAASDEGWLSINMNVYGYGRDPAIDRYTLGYVNGSIGPHRRSSPKHFVVGRQMIPVLKNPVTPAQNIGCFTCLVNEEQKQLSADFGNCLPIEQANGGFEDLGPLLLALAKDELDQPAASLPATSVQILGEVGYQGGGAEEQADWYARTAGIVDLDYGAAGAWVVENINTRPLLLLKPVPAAGGGQPEYQVMVQESIGGLYARADQFVYRLNPGEDANVDMCTSRYGKPYSTRLVFDTNTGGMGGTGGPPGPAPDINTGKVDYPQQLETDASGRATLRIHAPEAGPGNPRGYIDGQLYGVGYTLPAQPADSPQNFWNFISLLVFDRIEVPASPTWYADIAPIFTQYANLYPIMSRHLINLADYDSVIPHVRILEMAFSLPLGDPNHMPVTRDLSEAKRQMILRWLRQPGPDGKPLKGVPAPAKAVPAAEMAIAPEPEPALHLEPLQTGGKTAVLMAYEARQNKLREST